METEFALIHEQLSTQTPVPLNAPSGPAMAEPDMPQVPEPEMLQLPEPGASQSLEELPVQLIKLYQSIMRWHPPAGYLPIGQIRGGFWCPRRHITIARRVCRITHRSSLMYVPTTVTITILLLPWRIITISGMTRVLVAGRPISSAVTTLSIFVANCTSRRCCLLEGAPAKRG